MLWSTIAMLRITIICVCIFLVNVCGDSDVSTTMTVPDDKMPSALNITTEPSMSSETAGTASPGPPPDPPNTGVPIINATSDTVNTTEMLPNLHKSRALNFTAEPPLDDVSMDNEEDDMSDGNSTHCTPGQTFDRSCDETCKCDDNGGVICGQRPPCVPPYVRPTMETTCHQTPSKDDPCCVLLMCSNNETLSTEIPPDTDHCVYKNETYKKGDTFNDACEAVCSCDDAGHVSCKPRCTVVANTTSDRCVAVPDTVDPCCTVVLCDVSLQDHELSRPGSTGPEESDQESGEIQLISAIPVNSTAVKLNTSSKLAGKNWSVDVGETEGAWKSAMTSQGSTVLGLEPSKTYYIRVKVDGATSNTVQVTLPAAKKAGGMCEFKGKNYTRGEEFHDACNAYCVCGKTGVECATIECPTDFGLDVLDPHCLSWETQPANFVPTPPNCCPESVQCKDNGSCIYAGESFPNWAHIPAKYSGCEQRCFCEMGNVTCHAACPPVPAGPPHDLPCSPNQAVLGLPPGDDCCLYWFCPQVTNSHEEIEKNTDNKTLTNNDNESNLRNNITVSQDPFLVNVQNSDHPPHPKIPPIDKIKTTKDQTNLKKDFFPGPFSLQHLQDKVNKTNQLKTKSHKDHNYEHVVEDTIWPFQINKEAANKNEEHFKQLHKNDTMINNSSKSAEESNESSHQYVPDSEYEEEQDDLPDSNEDFLHHPFSLLPKGIDKVKPTKSKEKEERFHDDFLHHPLPFTPQGADKGKHNKHKEDKEHESSLWNFNSNDRDPSHQTDQPMNNNKNNDNNSKLIKQNEKNSQFSKGNNKISPSHDQMFLNQNVKIPTNNPSKIEYQNGQIINDGNDNINNKNNEHLYLIHNQQLPYGNNEHGKNNENNGPPIIHVPEFQVPYPQHDKQKSKSTINNNGVIQELIPIGNNANNNDNKHGNTIQHYHIPPEELYSHLQNIPQQFSNNHNNKENIPPQNRNIPSDHEILHVIHQQQANIPGGQNRYLSPEEIYLIDHQDKIPDDNKNRFIFDRNPLLHHHQQQQQHQKQKQGIIQIHNPNIPQLHHHVLPVDEIIAHIRQHEEENNQRYPFSSSIPQHPFIPPPIQHNQNQPQPLPPPPAVRQIPIITHFQNPSGDLQTQHTSSPLLLGHGHGQQIIQNSTRQGIHNHHLPPGFHNNAPQDPNEIKVHSLEAIDESTVRLVFSVPGVLVGLHGRVELRYTADKQNSDPATWEQQILAPEDDLIATPELEFELGSLQPDTTYKIKIAVVLRDLKNSPASKILTVKTPPSLSATTLPAMIPVEPDLRIAEINSTWARLVWRKFTDFELQFIDGVQLRYKETDDKVYAATPLIHRAVTSYVLEGLKPDSQYEVGIYFIPFPGQTTELTAQRTLHLSTSIENDPYKFDLNLTVHHVKASSVELSWSGVPYPEDKYVNIFRAIYQSDGGKEDFNSFKVAKRDSPPNTLIKGLKPNTRYRLWLEAYLTNGRIKKSNVKDFITKTGSVPVDETHTGKLEGMPLVEANDYYGPLVAVSILAALAIVAVMILLLILARKHGHNKAPITTATTRKVQSAAYDNPSYKTCENDMANGRTELTTMNPNV